jgi:hypothetical protein
MFPVKVARAAGTGGSVPVEACQVCGHDHLETVLLLGYMPPVNPIVPIGQVERQQPWFEAHVRRLVRQSFGADHDSMGRRLVSRGDTGN